MDGSWLTATLLMGSHRLCCRSHVRTVLRHINLSCTFKTQLFFCVWNVHVVSSKFHIYSMLYSSLVIYEMVMFHTQKYFYRNFIKYSCKKLIHETSMELLFITANVWIFNVLCIFQKFSCSSEGVQQKILMWPSGWHGLSGRSIISGGFGNLATHLFLS